MIEDTLEKLKLTNNLSFHHDKDLGANLVHAVHKYKATFAVTGDYYYWPLVHSDTLKFDTPQHLIELVE